MNDNSCALTVFVTTYNRSRYLKLMLDSIQTQSFREFKVVVLDNCSSDDTEKIVKNYLNDKRFEYIRHKNNLGGLGNINYAFATCKTEFFCIFHDDDILRPDILEKEFTYINSHSECVAVTCKTNIINDKGKIVKKNSQHIDDICTSFSGKKFFESYICEQKYLNFPTTMYRNEFVRNRNLMLNRTVGPCADVVLYMDIERNGGTVTELAEACLDYRVYDSQDSSSNFESMHIELMRYLTSDIYYKKLLDSNKKGKQKYAAWFARKLVIRKATGKLNGNRAMEYMNDMVAILQIRNLGILIYRILIIMEMKWPLVFKKIYEVAKRTNKK